MRSIKKETLRTTRTINTLPETKCFGESLATTMAAGLSRNVVLLAALVLFPGIAVSVAAPPRTISSVAIAASSCAGVRLISFRVSPPLVGTLRVLFPFGINVVEVLAVLQEPRVAHAVLLGGIGLALPLRRRRRRRRRRLVLVRERRGAVVVRLPSRAVVVHRMIFLPVLELLFAAQLSAGRDAGLEGRMAIPTGAAVVVVGAVAARGGGREPVGATPVKAMAIMALGRERRGVFLLGGRRSLSL